MLIYVLMFTKYYIATVSWNRLVAFIKYSLITKYPDVQFFPLSQ